ncbi:hypothetical protein HAX54_049020, partial [Datura stramonium]|nr:hypothetical protein [Datura stramonium]
MISMSKENQRKGTGGYSTNNNVPREAVRGDDQNDSFGSNTNDPGNSKNIRWGTNRITTATRILQVTIKKYWVGEVSGYREVNNKEEADASTHITTREKLQQQQLERDAYTEVELTQHNSYVERAKGNEVMEEDNTVPDTFNQIT